jgi:hypothetical protein
MIGSNSIAFIGGRQAPTLRGLLKELTVLGRCPHLPSTASTFHLGGPQLAVGRLVDMKPPHSKEGRVEKTIKRHREELSDVAILLAFT